MIVIIHKHMLLGLHVRHIQGVAQQHHIAVR